MIMFYKEERKHNVKKRMIKIKSRVHFGQMYINTCLQVCVLCLVFCNIEGCYVMYVLDWGLRIEKLSQRGLNYFSLHSPNVCIRMCVFTFVSLGWRIGTSWSLEVGVWFVSLSLFLSFSIFCNIVSLISSHLVSFRLSLPLSASLKLCVMIPWSLFSQPPLDGCIHNEHALNIQKLICHLHLLSSSLFLSSVLLFCSSILDPPPVSILNSQFSSLYYIFYIATVFQAIDIYINTERKRKKEKSPLSRFSQPNDIF